MKKKLLFLTLGIIATFCLQYTLAKHGFSKKEYSLYKASYMGRTKIVRRLAQNGVNVNIQSPNSKRTPLHIAAHKGRGGIVDILIKNGANLEIKNIDGQTPLFFAAKKGRLNVIRILVENGAQITNDIIEISRNDDIRNYLENALKESKNSYQNQRG